MKFFKLLLVSNVFILSTFWAQGQNDSTDTKTSEISFGVGGGLDYGGLGVHLSYFPIKHVGVFGGVGSMIADPGYNAGIKFRTYLDQFNNVSVFAIAMYGSNSAVRVKDGSDFNRVFSGPSVGSGFDIVSKKKKNSYWSLGLIYPLRPSEYSDYIETLKLNPRVEITQEPWPITITIGCNFVF